MWWRGRGDSLLGDIADREWKGSAKRNSEAGKGSTEGLATARARRGVQGESAGDIEGTHCHGISVSGSEETRQVGT